MDDKDEPHFDTQSLAFYTITTKEVFCNRCIVEKILINLHIPMKSLNITAILLLLSTKLFFILPIDGLRILGIFPMNVKSHFVTCEELMRGLAGKGHQVDVYSHFPLKESVANYNDFSLEGSLPAVTNNLTFEITKFTTATEAIVTWLELGGKSACKLMNLPTFQSLLKNPPIDPPYDLVIVEVSLANCYLAWGRHLKIPIIGVVAPLLPDWLHEHLGNPVNLAVEASAFATFAVPQTFFQRLTNIYTFYHLKYSFNHYVREQDEFVEKFFGKGYPDTVELQKDLSLVLVNHIPALNGLRTFAPSVVPIGGLHIVDRNESLPQDLQKWLDESKDGFIYFSFGSMVRIETFPHSILAAFYQSFRNIAPVRVLLKIANTSDLPAGLPSNVITKSWLPQIQILKHRNIRAFVTHGGLMGTQEAAYYGVPMVGVPLISDEFFNVANIVHKNIAVEVPLHKINEHTFTTALQEILRNTSYKKNAVILSQKIKSSITSPIDTATFWVEYIANHGEAALRMPIINTPWWKIFHLDIFIFVSLVLVTLLYITNKSIQILVRRTKIILSDFKKKNN